MEHSPAFHRQSRHLLRLLSHEGTRLLPTGMGDFVLERRARRTREIFDARLIETLIRNDLLARNDPPSLIISDAGRAHAARAEAAARNMPLDAFRRQHMAVDAITVPEAGRGNAPISRDPVFRDSAESVLTLLARARGNSQPFLARDELEAGERLRADMTLAALVPRLTANLSACGAYGGKVQGAPMTERIVSARQRVNRALEAVGHELSGVLFDICGMNMGLETVEERRNWPRRSAKLVLKLALGGLARHYAGARPAA